MTFPGPSSRAPNQRRRHYPHVDASDIVPKPTPDGDPRTVELAQLQRRFNLPSTSGTVFALSLKPSDPDFVYSINVLKLRLTVPASYRGEPSLPNPPVPSIEVLNPEIPLGYRVNVERGFAELAEGRPTATLLQLMNALDRSLEAMLSEEKAETLKIVPNFSPAATPGPPPQAPPAPRTPPPAERKAEAEVEVRVPASPPVSVECRAAAKARRDTETRQLEARLKLSNVFARSADGIEYIVPLESRRKDLLPVPLLPIRTVRLIVPMAYDLKPPRIELVGVPDEIGGWVRDGFARFVEENRSVSLIAAVNVLAARLHTWAIGKEETPIAKNRQDKETAEAATRRETQAEAGEGKQPSPAPDGPLAKTHVKVIPRPPEWSFPDAEDGDGGDDDDDYSGLEESSGGEEVDNGHAAATADGVPHAAQERGTSLSCPGIQMSGVELVEVLKLNVSVKCTKCKQERETLNLQCTPPGTAGKPQAFRCEKCSEIMGIGMPPSLPATQWTRRLMTIISFRRFPQRFHPPEFPPPRFLRPGRLRRHRDPPQLLYAAMHLLDAATCARNEGHRARTECFRQLSGMPPENEFVFPIFSPWLHTYAHDGC